MTNHDAIDLTRVAALGDPRTSEGQKALGEILQLYFDNVAAAFTEMRRATAPDEVRKQAHRAKGASGVVGAQAMVGMFADIEIRAAAGETISGDTIDELERRLAEMRLTASAQIGQDLQ